MSSNKTIESIILIFLIGIVVYLPSLFGQFIWDDEDFVYQNQYVKEFRIDKFFSSNIEEGRGKTTNYYRPIQLTVYATTHAIFGFNPHAYHAVSILFHLIASSMIFLFFWRFSKQYFLSFISCLIFLIHPLQTEVASYISGLSDSLFVTFGMMSLIFYLEKKRKYCYLLSLVSFLLCILSKETGLVFLGMIGLLWLLRKNWHDILLLIPYGLITIGYLMFHFTFINQENLAAAYGNNPYTHSILVRLATFIQNLYTYIALLIFPNTLFMERDHTISILTNLFDWHIIVFIVIIVGVCLGLYIKRNSIKNLPVVLFSLMAFFGTFVPYMGIVLINGIFYEHFLYLPLLFFFSFFFFLLDIKPQKLVVIVLVIWLSILTLRSYVRQYQWIDPIRFYTQTLQHAPLSLRVHNNLGMAYADKGDLDRSIAQYNKSITIDPTVPNLYHNLGNAYAGKGDLKKAELYYLEAINKDPNFYFSYISLINLYQYAKDQTKLQLWVNKTKSKFPHLIK